MPFSELPILVRARFDGRVSIDERKNVSDRERNALTRQQKQSPHFRHYFRLLFPKAEQKDIKSSRPPDQLSSLD